jgi:hypothetical protein
VLSVQRIRGLVEVLKMEKSSIIKEETCGRRSRGSGGGTLEGFLEANEGLREVVGSDFKSRPLDLEGHMEKNQCITNLRPEETELGEERTPEVDHSH